MTDNPYAPPSESGNVEPSADSAGDELARRFTRLAASIVDGVLLMGVLIPVWIATGYFERATKQQVGATEQIAMSLLGMAVMLVFNCYFLLKRGQTIGKMLTKIQIVDARDGKLLPFTRVYIYRYLWMLPFVFVVALIPGPRDDLLVNVVALIDALLIFGSDRRCLHDYIAGSKVVAYVPNRPMAG